MNDVMNRFGYVVNAAHGRVPGPFVPLQDEPQEVGSIPAKNRKTILVPQIQSMTEYILKHHKRMLLRALNQSIKDGVLDLPMDVDHGQITLSSANCTFGEMNFWRYDKYTALADVIVKPEIFDGNALVTCPLYVELWINMKTGMEFYTGDCGLLKDLPDRPYWRLSKYMIPILRKDEIEAGSEALLLSQCPLALSDNREHDAYILAARMGLRVERLPLYKKARTLSMLFFCPGNVMVQDDPEDPNDDPPEPYTVTIPGDTILINTRAVHKDYCQLEIYHECIHYDWHFMFYRLQHMHTNDINALKTKRIVITDKTQNVNPLSWMEWQANRGSFGLMMPLSMMNPVVNKEKSKLAGTSLHWGKRYDIIIRSIAHDYDLPKFRVRARLLQMGFIAARGACNYVDGAYIDPFAFDLSKGNGNYVFVLTRKNYLDEYQSNALFREQMDSGDYVFVDGHICLNDERYVMGTAKGLKLTPWANEHVDECCLRFINVYEPCGLSEYVFGCLNSDEDVFDGNQKPDRVDRVTIDYHRITKIKPKNPVSDTVEYVTWDYSEKLVLDRESETLEHIQNIGSGCIVSRKYYVQGGVEGLLDDIDADELFGEIEGNPDDVVDTPLESKDYTITVDFKKGPQRVIQGTYDKKSLPEFWGDFAETVWQFIRFYGWGEILDPSVYEKIKRRKQDFIYCSVEFDEGYKSYYYISDEDNISVDDYVVVPVGKENHHSVAKVVKVEYFAEENVPLPLDRTKHIIRKCKDDDFDPPGTSVL